MAQIPWMCKFIQAVTEGYLVEEGGWDDGIPSSHKIQQLV